MIDDFEQWLLTLRNSIADYKYYTDFEKVVENARTYKTELYLLNSLIGSQDIEHEFVELITKYPNVIRVIPTLLAVPAIMLIAASIDAAFRSGIFISAISRILSLEIVATFVLLGTPDPDFRLQAFFRRTAAGGVFVMKEKDLS